MSWTHAIRLASYNSPLYVVAGSVAISGVITACVPTVPWSVRWVAAVGAVVAVWFASASFIAFHVMFDRSELLEGNWLPDLVTNIPARWIQIGVFLEQTTLPLERLFPSAEGKSLDLYNPAVMTEPAVTRGRRNATLVDAEPARPDSLPVADGWADLVVVMLAAHEVRDVTQREQLFIELRRIVSKAGRVIVIEHLRNIAAAMVFGPGLFHFYPRSEWIRLGRQAGLMVIGERSMTPFVHDFVFTIDIE